MVIWHDTEDAQRTPFDVFENDKVILWIGSYPVEMGQVIRVEIQVLNETSEQRKYSVQADWRYNDYSRKNSYWAAMIGPFNAGEKVDYRVVGTGSDQVEHIQVGSFAVRSRG